VEAGGNKVGGHVLKVQGLALVTGVLMSFTRWRHESLQAGVVKISTGRNAKFSTWGPPQPARGSRWGARWGMYPRPKDSNAAVGVHDRATGKALERADRQTNRLSVHYSKISSITVPIWNHFH